MSGFPRKSRLLPSIEAPHRAAIWDIARLYKIYNLQAKAYKLFRRSQGECSPGENSSRRFDKTIDEPCAAGFVSGWGIVLNRRVGISLTVVLLYFFMAVVPAQDQGRDVTIEYIAHACFRITAPSGNKLLIDPYGSRIWIGYDYPEEIEADAVLITHPHYDHDGGISRGHPAPWPDTMTVLREPGHYRMTGVEILGVAGKHADPYGKEFGQTNTIWVLEVAGLRIAHIGDNGPVSDAAAAQIGEVDVLMMPIDSEYHILKEHEIQTILHQLSPAILVPMHYRLSDLEPNDNEPDGLGGIDGWLKSRNNVRRAATHQTTISTQDLPSSPEILVFEHSPILERPQNEN